jgi:putative phosphoesterase
MKLGIISDTHGLLRPEALSALTGVDQILHAGDVGDPKILDALAAVAPLTAIRGNVDTRGRCSQLPPTEFVTVAGHNLYMLHDLHALDLDPAAAEIAAVISGHSHHPGFSRKKGVLYFNPGSAGPVRFSLPVTLGFLDVTEKAIEPSLLTLL